MLYHRRPMVGGKGTFAPLKRLNLTPSKYKKYIRFPPPLRIKKLVRPSDVGTWNDEKLL